MKRSASRSSPKAQPGSLSSCGGCSWSSRDDEHADAGALRHRLEHVGPRQHVRLWPPRPARTTLPSAHGDAGGAHHLLGALLVHGERRGQHAGVRVGDAQQLEQALHAAVLAPAPVQGVEADLGLHLGELLGEIAAGIDARHLVAGAFQRLGAGLARVEAHLALGRQPAHQHGDMVEAPRTDAALIAQAPPPAPPRSGGPAAARRGG